MDSITLKEIRKRKTEVIVIFVLAIFILGLTWFEIRLLNTSQQLPFMHSIFFFGLVNFNIILLLFLLFLIFRNLVKVFVERQGKVFGSSLRAKLVLAFVTFTVVPTTLLFITSVFYINGSFEKWFSTKMSSVLRSSIEVSNAYYFNAKKRNYHFAHQVAEDVAKLAPKFINTPLKKKLNTLRNDYALDAIEFYPNLLGERAVSSTEEVDFPIVPNVSREFLAKGLVDRVDASTIHQFADGNLVRVIVPVIGNSKKLYGAIVVSTFVPLSLISKMGEVSNAYDELRDINPIQYPLKSIYLTVLALMTLVILFAAIWFGFHLAKQLAVPLVELGEATQRISKGLYLPINVASGSEEINSLVDSFNVMLGQLETSRAEVAEYNQYIEVVLKNVSAGVISINESGVITTINQKAADLLKVESLDLIGKPVRDLLTLEYFRTFSQLLKTMQEHRVSHIQKEIKVNIQGEPVPLLMTFSLLKDDSGKDLGKVVVFDDLTPIVNAQRAAAWTEVARRMAHEIKNPLTPIRLSAERLQRKFGAQITDAAFNECTTMIIQQTEDLKNLVNEFSQFSRLPQTKPISGSIHKTIEDALGVFKLAHQEIDFELSLEQAVPNFKFDPDQMKRVFLNIIDNAISAVKDSVVKKVELETTFDSQLRILKITVSDTGVGIPTSLRGRVFEPYYSTKDTGTGLGLAITRRIVEDHNGLIRAFSNEPQGTKIVIELPVPPLET